nr:hypothetical protein [Tanacetum cinerariifolium]
ETHISQPGGSGTDEGTDDDEENQETAKYDERDDAEGGGNDEEEGESDEEDDNEEIKEEESFDPIPKTPKGSKDEGDGKEDQGLNVNKEEHVKEEEDELYRDQESSSVSSQFMTSMLNPTSDVADLQKLWVQFIDHINDRKLFISELDGLPPSAMSYNYCQFLQQVQENDFIKLLELRKMIAKTYREVHKKLDFVSVMKNM